VPTTTQVKGLTADLHSRAKLPAHVEPLIRSLPKHMHPMTQLVMGIMACQTESKYAAAYAKGIHKSEYWKPTFEDALDVIAKLPEIAALVYRCKFHDGKV
jgi:citrate synthase